MAVLCDAVVIAPSDEGGAKLALQDAAVDFLRDAYGRLEVIACLPSAAPLLVKGGLSDASPDTDDGLISLTTKPSRISLRPPPAGESGRVNPWCGRSYEAAQA